MEKLDQVCDSVTSLDNAFASAQEELMRVQARIEALKATQEVRAMEGSTLKSNISMVSFNIDYLLEEFIRRGNQIRSSLTEEEDLYKCLIFAFPK